MKKLLGGTLYELQLQQWFHGLWQQLLVDHPHHLLPVLRVRQQLRLWLRHRPVQQQLRLRQQLRLLLIPQKMGAAQAAPFLWGKMFGACCKSEWGKTPPLCGRRFS